MNSSRGTTLLGNAARAGAPGQRMAGAVSQSRQLDVLALEPYYGGVRRSMLEAISRCSRHRWRILKLPARRMERRLMVAATWFAESLARDPGHNVDVLFTSESLNLAELMRLSPRVGEIPSVVYFHDTQLPPAGAERPDSPADFVNLTTAMAAGETWFNSICNLRNFLSRASAVVARHPEFQVTNLMSGLTAKAQIVAPPVDLGPIHETAAQVGVSRDARAVLLDARDCDQRQVSQAFNRVLEREPIRLLVIGRMTGLVDSAKVTMLDERDEEGQLQSLLSAGVVVSARMGATADDLAVRALAAGCHPVVPNDGVYPELLPESMHAQCLHDGTPESLADRILGAWNNPRGSDPGLREILARYDAIRACRNIDSRLESIVVARSV